MKIKIPTTTTIEQEVVLPTYRKSKHIAKRCLINEKGIMKIYDSMIFHIPYSDTPSFYAEVSEILTYPECPKEDFLEMMEATMLHLDNSLV